MYTPNQSDWFLDITNTLRWRMLSLVFLPPPSPPYGNEFTMTN